MESLSIIPDELIVNKIYVISGQKVMIDSDLAELYGVETKVLNQAVKRNQDRFPKDFMFLLSDSEWENLKSQFVTSSWGGRRTLPYAFTEHGVLMLSSILNSKRAIQVNIQVMRIFTRIRQSIAENTDLRQEIEGIKTLVHNQNQNIEIVFQYLDELMEKKERPGTRKRIGFMPDDL
jgi:hypothetical protein